MHACWLGCGVSVVFELVSVHIFLLLFFICFHVESEREIVCVWGVGAFRLLCLSFLILFFFLCYYIFHVLCFGEALNLSFVHLSFVFCLFSSSIIFHTWCSREICLLNCSNIIITLLTSLLLFFLHILINFPLIPANKPIFFTTKTFPNTKYHKFVHPFPSRPKFSQWSLTLPLIIFVFLYN